MSNKKLTSADSDVILKEFRLNFRQAQEDEKIPAANRVNGR